MLPYQYHILEHHDSIRVVVLHPSSHISDPLVCTIRHVRLSDASLKYEALSYTWGDATHQKAIHFNDGSIELRIGTNCHNALQHLRQKDHDRVLWVDAISIDQKNLTERASQVRIMDKIFRSASGVTVYLGEETAGSHTLFKELAEVDLAQDGYGGPPPNDTTIRELEILFQRSWFQRVWVLQEVSMNDSVTFMCGSAGASSNAVYVCVFGHFDTRLTKNFQPLALYLVYRPPQRFSTPQFNLWHLVFESRMCSATDPRDRVFALRSLIGPGQTEMDSLINYLKSVEEIFIEVAMFLLPVIGLRILTAVRHPHEKMDMPSWIPDWSQNLPLSAVFFFDESCEPGSIQYLPTRKPLNEHQIRRVLDRENNPHFELPVKGCRYAEVVYKSEMFSFANSDDAEVQMKKLYNSFDSLRVLADLEDIEDSCTMYEQLGQEIVDAMSLFDGGVLQAYLVREAHRLFKTYSDVELVHHFFNSLQLCRVILMDNGELAIVGRSVHEGDVVCVFSGADSPCALRSNENGTWTLVSGDCFIFTESFKPYMSAGEFMCDDYVAHHQDRLEEFKLR
ncbi:uncharacterized protein K460DRAFT_396592 [Cucurbitaria berberidis CBS 394.84]|uniref:Heterokaryon incompatibility domain-containing protein n=1 Tax=Cucurbitaria berberidis CBS 394.84 TaxID=1168544 RepID=A0A9P4GDG4_9PLEO|nr:uncharacterized protein K460DRAFT_396592 [Cucurbitaria berberidis CBS 394.84]KAF1843234.1 hypothetical protein K460DRAFT_396592 [Cucurbitaria berberidis CBS 394.84]